MLFNVNNPYFYISGAWERITSPEEALQLIKQDDQYKEVATVLQKSFDDLEKELEECKEELAIEEARTQRLEEELDECKEVSKQRDDAITQAAHDLHYINCPDYSKDYILDFICNVESDLVQVP